MSKGRRPKPQPLPANTPTCVEPPSPPTWLDSGALAEWERITPTLLANGLLSDADVAAMAMYCQTYSQYVDCQHRLNEDGLQLGAKLHPLARHADTLGKQLRGLIADFGFTPSSRGRLEVGDGESNELADFLNAT